MTPERWQRVKELFQTALEGEASQRAAFLDDSCAGDPALRRQVEALIASHEQEPSFLEAPAFEVGAPTLEEDEAELMIGQRIGPYELVREIGHGGMGAVYLAVRADDEYQKQVAIKLVKRGMDTDAILRRFRNERQILANLDHPHIAKLLDGGTTSDGLPYFVMDYVEGLPIDGYYDTNELPTLERLKLFRTVCSAIHYAHQNHVVHRDLKPSNILVTAEGVPKLLDFGIAKLLNPELPSQTVDSTAALRFMTPEYASPEQVREETLTPASDVYSLGVLLYELLTGHRPYRLGSRTPPEVARIICEEEPEKPSTVISRVEEVPGPDGTLRLTPESVSQTREGHPEKLRRRLSGDLDNIVLMALRKEPNRRYASVEQFSEDVRRHLEGLPVIARKDTLSYRATKFIKRNKASVIMTALFAMVLIALLTAGLYLFLRRDTAAAKGIESLAVLPLENLSGDASQDYFADGMTEALITDLGKIGGLRVIPRPAVLKYKGARKPLPEIAKELKVDAVVVGSVSRSEERVRITGQLIEAATERQLWSHSYERDLRDILALQRGVARAIADEIRVKLTAQEEALLAKARPVNLEAYDYYLRGRFFANRRSKADNQAAIELLERVVTIDPTWASGHAVLARVYLDRFFHFAPKEQKQWEEKATVALEKALSLDPDLAEAYVARGRLLWTPSNRFPHEKATQEYRRALTLNPNSDEAHKELGVLYNHIGLLDEGLQELRKAAAINPNAASLQFHIGEAFLWQGKYDQALPIWLSIRREDLQSFSWAYTAWALFQLGRKDEAEATIEEFLKDHAEDTQGAIAGMQALLLAARGEERKSEDKVKIATERKAFGPFHHTAYFIACAYARMNRAQPAIDWLQYAADNGFPCYPLSERDSNLDPIRKDPRFAEFLAKQKAQWEHYKATLFQ